jgi:hypothetical protein
MILYTVLPTASSADIDRNWSVVTSLSFYRAGGHQLFCCLDARSRSDVLRFVYGLVFYETFYGRGWCVGGLHFNRSRNWLDCAERVIASLTFAYKSRVCRRDVRCTRCPADAFVFVACVRHRRTRRSRGIFLVRRKQRRKRLV